MSRSVEAPALPQTEAPTGEYRPRVLLAIRSLGAGGAERVISLMASHWAARGCRVTLVTTGDPRIPDFHPLTAEVERRAIGRVPAGAGVAAQVVEMLRVVLHLRGVLREVEPDVCIGFTYPVNVALCLASRGLRVPVIISERNNLEGKRLRCGWRGLIQAIYPLADRLVVQTERLRSCFSGRLQPRIRVIPNPVLAGTPADSGWNGEAAPCIAAAGRLVPQKGFDVLLRAFARIAGRHPGSRLVIYGGGPLRAELTRLVDSLGLAGRVELPGVVDHLQRRLPRASLFVLSSRFEGFPNVLCEAMANGLAVIAADCPTGPREIIRPGIDGVLIPPDDVDALARAMDRLLQDPAERRRLGEQASTITERFGLARVMALWDAAVAEVLRPPRGRTWPMDSQPTTKEAIG